MGFLLTFSGKQIVSLQADQGRSPLSLQHAIPKIFSKSTITAQPGITMPEIQLCCQAQRATHQIQGKFMEVIISHVDVPHDSIYRSGIVGDGLFLNEQSKRGLIKAEDSEKMVCKIIFGKRRWNYVQILSHCFISSHSSTKQHKAHTTAPDWAATLK